ncbi:hypothetical protein CPB86DRAFT_819543 [Serendipita vermifera]|nr:hypothetical protein CPB86DRAFT_819543 [Serendipita vermifera]
MSSPGATQNGTISPTRKRVLSNPGYGTPGTISASPYRPSFKPGSPGSPVLNGMAGHQRNGSSTSFVPGHIRNGSTSSYGSDANNVRGSISSASGRPSFSTPNGQATAPYGPPGAHGFQFRGGHARSPSTNSDIAGSPFRSTFASINEDHPDATLSTSSSIQGSTPPSDAPPSPTLANSSYHNSSSSVHARRHSRIHSRNLSIYFPRPGATTVHSIAEDGAQEIEAPVTLISGGGPTPTIGSGRTRPTPKSSTFVSSPQPRTQLGGGFKFGGKPPPSTTSNSQSQSGNTSPTGSEGPGSVPMSKVATPNTSTSQSTGTASRRGHHHRHSLSHSFFSFMEPSPSASSPAYNHRKQPSSGLTLSVTSPSPTSTNTPISALPTASGWGPISPFPLSTTAATFPSAQVIPPKRTMSFHPAALPNPSTQRSSSLIDKVTTLPAHLRNSLAFASLEVLLGCILWIMGQHAESLACTGLAYWIVFDALGVGLGVYGRLVDAGAGQGSLRLPYGAKRIETTAIFAQAVYLMFAAVYICKETLEHALLSAGDAGHHHHHEQGRGGVLSTGLDYPYTLLWLSFIALSLSCVLFKNNVKVLDATGVYLPSIRQTLRFFSSPSKLTTTARPSSTLLFSNPYTLFPLLCTGMLLSISTLPITQESQRTADMLIAGIEAAGTGWLAWPACLTLGKVLLQMAPERSPPGSNRSELTATKGTMEALLRAMKEIERHPQVLHLPAPHIWQLSPPSSYFNSIGTHSSAWEGKTKEDDSYGGASNGHSHSPSNTSLYSRLKAKTSTPPAPKSGHTIVTMELHVRKDLDDVECLELTRWAWQRCINALGQGDSGVSVGIVRG